MRGNVVIGSVMGLLALCATPVTLGVAAGADVTPAYGPFGFTTQGLGKTATYGEPSFAIAPDGKHEIVSTPGAKGVNYWYSADGGSTWATTTTKYGGGDSALDFLPDGTAVSADLRVVAAAPPNSGITLSHDFGKTWDMPIVGAGGEQDRQWLAHSPDGKTAYMVYHDFALEAEFIAVSKDGGKTWTQGPGQGDLFVNSVNQVTALPIALGGQTGTTASLFDQGVNTFSGPILVDKNGKDLYVVYSISDFVSNLDPTTGVPPFGPVRALVVAHSSDGGASFSNVLADVAQNAPGPSESIENTLFPWGFLDAAGNVYVVFDSTRDGATGDHFHQYYVYSTDKGKTWSKPVKLDTLARDKGATVYAAGDGGAPGVIDVGWYQSDNGTPSDNNAIWTPHFAQVTAANTANPHVVEQAITTVPNHKGGICLQGILCGVGPGSDDRSLADFFQVKINPVDGLAQFAYADNNRLGLDAAGKKIGEVVVAHQTVAAASTISAPAAAPRVAPPVTLATPNTAAANPLTLRLLLFLLGFAVVAAAVPSARRAWSARGRRSGSWSGRG